ncbi:MAG: tail fiber protein [Chloroflexota bacterium]
MADAFTGEVRIFGGSFAIRDWAFCNGQTIDVSQNPALFGLLGAIYGGDGRNDFGVPNLQGRAPMGAGHGPGLTDRRPGQRLGSATVTLTQNQIPSHTHTVMGDTAGDERSPVDNYLEDCWYELPPDADYGGTVTSAGGGGSHNNMQPYQTLNFLICLSGVYPSQS